MKRKFVTMIDPPSGWRYGFPMPAPIDYIAGGFDLKDWLIRNGYPEKDAEWAAKHCRYWTQEIDD